MCHCGHHLTHPSAASLHEYNANRTTNLVVLMQLYILSGETAHVLLIKLSRGGKTSTQDWGGISEVDL